MMRNHCPLLHMQRDISWLLLSIFPLSQPVLQGVAHKIETGGKKQRQSNRTGLTSCPKGGEVKKTKRDNVKRFFRTLRLYFLTETPREKRLNPVTTAAGIFQPLRHYVPPPLYFALQNTGEECMKALQYRRV